MKEHRPLWVAAMLFGASLFPSAMVTVAVSLPVAAVEVRREPSESARNYINRGQWAAATEALERVTAGDAKVSRDMAWLAFAYLYQGKRDKLKDLQERATKMGQSESDPVAGKLVRIFFLVSQGKLDETSKEIGQLPPGHDDLLSEFARACIALKTGRLQDAVEHCERAVEIDPNFAWGYRTLGFIQEKSLKNPGSAERAYARALSIAPEFGEVRDLLVELRVSRNDFDNAVLASQEAVKRYPKDADNYYRLAQVFVRQWRLLEALDVLEKGARLAPKDSRFFRSRAAIFRHQGRLTEAIEEQRLAVELSRDKAFELMELAWLLELNQETGRAISTLQELLKDYPNHEPAHQKLVALLERERRFDELAAEFRRSIAIKPESADLHLGLGRALKATGAMDEALAEFKAAATLDQTNPTPHRETAKLELERKNYDQAARAYTHALNINPACVEDLVALGYCYASREDYMQAETAFVTALALQQLGMTAGSPVAVSPFDIMRSLGAVLLREGRYSEAALNLETVVLKDAEPAQKKQDEFMLSQCKALRDRTSKAAAELIEKFKALSEEERSSELNNVVATLVRVEMKGKAVDLLSEIGQDRLEKTNPLLHARYLQLQGKLAEASDLLAAHAAGSKSDPEELGEANLLLGLVRVDKGDMVRARESFSRAVEIDPKLVLALVEMAKLDLAERKIESAIGSAKRALEVNPYCAEAYLVLGEAYLRAGKLVEAEENCFKASELYPAWISAHRSLREVYQKQSKTSQARQEEEIIRSIESQGANSGS